MSKGHLYIFLTALISGASVYLNKFSVSVINPYIFTGVKNAAVVVLLGLVILGAGRWKELRRLSRRQWYRLIVVGFVGGGVPFLLFFKGLSLTSASQGALIHKSMFLWAGLLAALLLKERFNRWSLVGLASIGAGIWLMSQGKLQPLGLGDGLVLIATLLWAVEAILAKRALADISSLVVAWGRMFFGLLVIVGFWAVSGQLPALGKITASQLSWIGLTSALLFGYVMTWYAGLRRLPVTVATAILTLGFPITSILAVLFDGKSFTADQLVGFALMTLGAVPLLLLQRNASRLIMSKSS
ncbi:MAG: DMT family transporter [Patescibacteria group bacterium]